MQRDGGPGGAGGAGNPTGGSFTGPAEALEIIGDHAYAYSGQITLNNNSVTQLLFTNGNFYMVAKYQFFVDIEALGSNRVIGFEIKLNDSLIIESKYYSSAALSVADIDMPINVIIPPYTAVEITGVTDNPSDINSFATLTGRIYRG